jgi:hypothetical protein
MFPKTFLKCIPIVKAASTNPMMNYLNFMQMRATSRRCIEIATPPQRHLTFFVLFKLYFFNY